MTISDRLWTAGFVLWLLVATVRLLPTIGWQQTNGIVTDVDYTEVADDDGTAATPFRDVIYTYQVNGIEFRGTNVWRGFDLFSLHSFPLLSMDLHPQKQVVVHYDPRNPSAAVLSRTYSPSEAVVMLVGPILMWWERRRTRQRTQPSPGA